MRIFVTGGSGFIGTNLVSYLMHEGIPTLNFDIRPPQDPRSASVYFRGDILDRTALVGAIKMFSPTVIIHLAARCDLDGHSLNDYAPNIRGVENVLSGVSSCAGIMRAIFASTRYVHSNESQPTDHAEYSPFTVYGESKVRTEQIVRASDISATWVIVRPTSIWGPWFKVPYRGFFDAIKRGVYVHPKGEHIYKSFGYVGNVVHQLRALIDATDSAVRSRVLYLADYEPIDVLAMADEIRRNFNAPPIREVPLSFLSALASSGDLLKSLGWRNPPLSTFRLNNLRCNMVYDLSATKQIVGPLPYSMSEGVRATVDWMRKNY